jgi:hypothetical protein
MIVVYGYYEHTTRVHSNPGVCWYHFEEGEIVS